MRSSFFVAALLFSCGPSQIAGEPASLAQEIRGGTLDGADPAVVAIAARSSQTSYDQFCSGTLIGAKTVLTAAHCINAYGTGSFYYVLFGSNVDSPTRRVHVANQYKDPLYNGDAHDFGLLQLDEIVTSVTPIELNTSALSTSDIGRSIRHAGFGTTDGTNGSGLKRTVTYAVRDVTAQLIESGATGKQTCGGDSGGPAFMTFGGVEKVAGVVSFGDEMCLQDGWDGRVDYGATWIKQTMSPWEVPTCADDGKCLAGCTPVDPDCACVADGQCTAECTRPSKDPDCPANCDADGVCAIAVCPRADPDCVAEGSACSAPTQCRGRLCVTDPQHQSTYCSTNCGGDLDCPNGMQCLGAKCALPQLEERQPGDTCNDLDFCVLGRICDGPAGGITRCVLPCDSVSNCLSTNDSCETGSTGQRFCRSPDMSFEPPRIDRAPEEYPALSTCSSAGGVSVLAALAWLNLLTRGRRRFT